MITSKVYGKMYKTNDQNKGVWVESRKSWDGQQLKSETETPVFISERDLNKYIKENLY